MIRSSIQQTITLTQVGRLGLELNLDPSFSNIVGLSLATIQGTAIQNPSQFEFGKEFSNIKPTLISSLAQYGVEKLGTSLGIDPRISSLGSISFGNAISASMAGRNVIQSVNDGLLRGATSLGINWAMDKAQVDPLVGSILGRSITGALLGLMSKTGFLNGAFNGVINSSAKLPSLGETMEPPDPNSVFYKAHPELLNEAWLQYDRSRTAYLSKVISFSDVVKSKGLVPAVESIAISLFHQDTLEDIWKQGGLADLITNKADITMNERKNIQLKRIYLNTDRTDFMDMSLDGLNVVAIKQGNVYENSVFDIGPDGIPYPRTSTRWISEPDGGQTVQHIMQYKLTLSERYDKDGVLMQAIYPKEGQAGILINPNTGEIIDGHTIDFEGGYEYTVSMGQLVSYTDKGFLTKSSQSTVLGLSGNVIYDALGLDQYHIQDLDGVDLNIQEDNGEVKLSVTKENDPAKPITLGTSFGLNALASYLKDVYLPELSKSSGGDIFNLGTQKIKTGPTSYTVYTNGVRSEMYQNGLKLLGEFKPALFGAPIELLNGGVIYDISSGAYISARIENQKPVSLKLQGVSEYVTFAGTKATDGSLVSGELKLMNKDVIVFQGGIPIGYYKTTNQDQTLKALDYASFLGLLYDIQPQVGQVSGSGIYNGMSNDVETDFLSYHNEIKTAYNSFFPDDQITKDATIPLFKNSTPFEQFFTLLKEPDLGNALALYNEIYRPKTLSEQIQFMSQLYDTARDPVAVGMNQIFDQLTGEARTEFNSRYASQAGYSLLDGFSMIMESGFKTAAIRYLNENMPRVYSAISVSGNISDKISNPYTKLFVNFTSNHESPVVGVTTSYSVSDIFRYPSNGQQVYNIQFDDDSLNSNSGNIDFNHVTYARNDNHPYHEFFVRAAALSEYAVYDDGQAFRNLIIRAKGFSSDGELESYIRNNNGVVTIGQADVDRAK